MNFYFIFACPTIWLFGDNTVMAATITMTATAVTCTINTNYTKFTTHFKYFSHINIISADINYRCII